MAKMTAQDRKWQAEEDAHILASSVALQKDKKRVAAATKVLEKKAEEANKTVKSVRSVSKKATKRVAKKPAKGVSHVKK